MKAILKNSTEQGLTLVDNHPMPEIKSPTDVLVRVKATAICGTDLDIYKSDPDLTNRMKPIMPVVVGHEFCGEVVEVGTGVEKVKPGDYVSAEMHILCKECINCRTGNGHVCINTIIKGIDADGCFAEYVIVPAANIIKLPQDLPVEVAAYLDAIGNAVHTLSPVDVVARSVAILGAGPIGIMGAKIAKISGAREVLITDVNQSLLDIAAQNGADHTFNVSSQEGRQAFLEHCKKDRTRLGVDVVVEMSGHPTAYDDLFECVRMGGEVLLLGLPREPISINFNRDVVFKGLTIRGIIGRRTYDTWFRMLGMIETGLLETLQNLVTHTMPLEEFQKGFDVKLKGEGLKVIFKP
ncbi:L-threonine 3-dehydrogenase [candidate division LCP-89 bacterium B3_LCP]|uniref:L-threonine 3-dehydrogenase n=1 Tax=candidate division LCP-89 bacterium B3_LCP TaxID=2012998 RepID=A0A532V0Q0_UNCL8|nr:MAG: L-threonine 3-dehydrogenase [candidate division LCP-89 bacterium B3_LCP]